MSEAIPPNNFHVPTPGELAPHFPGYEIQDLIAKSGTEAVYRAHQVSLGRMVAIKILPWDVKDDWRMRAEFEAEARAMARLRHPNLIAVYDFGEVSGMLFVVRELFAAKSLFNYSNGRAIAPLEAVNLVGGICKGLTHAHQNGILHCNLKPNNILLSAQKELKIKNFRPFDPLPGADKACSDAQRVPGYRAPELENAPHLVDLRADVYAVGVVLHELLTGKMPAEDPRLPSEISGCDQRFDEIIRRATDPFPAYRYPGLEELDADLQAFVAPVPAPRQSPQTQPIAVAASSRKLITRPPVPYRAPVIVVKRKSKVFSWIGTLLIGALIAGLIYYLKFSAPGNAGRQGGNKALEPQISGIVDLAAKSHTTEIPMTRGELMLLLNRAIAEKPSGLLPTYYKALFQAKSTDGTDIDGEIAKFATSREMPPEVREVLIRDVLRMRKNPSIVPVLIDYAHSTADPRSAVASIQAIRFMADETYFHRLISLIYAKSNPEVHKAVEEAVAQIIKKSKQRVQIEASLAASYRDVTRPEERHLLLRLMGHCGGAKPLEVVREALQSNEPDLKSAALSSLGVWGDDAGFPILLDLLANPQSEPFRVQTFEVALKFVIARARISADPQHWIELKKQAKTHEEHVGMIRAIYPLDHEWALQLLEEYTRSTDARVADFARKAIPQVLERRRKGK